MEESDMRIAVLSGKGGTGKTFISVNMAAAAGKSIYMDCDVEEPNGYLFFKPEKVICRNVSVRIPSADMEKCTECRICTDFCRFNALVSIKGKLLVFDEVCHSCGGCLLVCPTKALSEKDKTVGEIRIGVSGKVNVLTGILNIGEASGIPIIKELMKETDRCREDVFTDCPPGSACIVMESIKDADYCVLVAEPTLFGVHNLNMVHELVKLFNKPCGVVLNKCMDGENPAEDYCTAHGVNILAKIPFDRELGEFNSNALIAARESQKYRELFSMLNQHIRLEVHGEKASYSKR
jgi:MinD superfamily P-loop ATPase